MKLVDLDKVRWVDGYYDMHTGEQYAPMMFNTEEWIEWATAEAKVAAIPIEWIEQFMNRFRLGMVTSDEYALLHFMLTEWENENNSN